MPAGELDYSPGNDLGQRRRWNDPTVRAERVTQKLERLERRSDSGLLGMEAKAALAKSSLRFAHNGAGVSLGSAKKDEVVAVANEPV